LLFKYFNLSLQPEIKARKEQNKLKHFRMANHKSALKRIRQSEARRLHNRYYSRTMRNAIKKLRSLDNKKEATEQLSAVLSLIDKNAKRSIIHKNKAGNLKSKLTKHVSALA